MARKCRKWVRIFRFCFYSFSSHGCYVTRVLLLCYLEFTVLCSLCYCVVRCCHCAVAWSSVYCNSLLETTPDRFIAVCNTGVVLEECSLFPCTNGCTRYSPVPVPGISMASIHPSLTEDISTCHVTLRLSSVTSF